MLIPLQFTVLQCIEPLVWWLLNQLYLCMYIFDMLGSCIFLINLYFFFYWTTVSIHVPHLKFQLPPPFPFLCVFFAKHQSLLPKVGLQKETVLESAKEDPVGVHIWWRPCGWRMLHSNNVHILAKCVGIFCSPTTGFCVSGFSVYSNRLYSPPPLTRLLTFYTFKCSRWCYKNQCWIVLDQFGALTVLFFVLQYRMHGMIMILVSSGK